jgi:hypothetical protein
VRCALCAELLDALQYHREQTRPINRTTEILARARAALRAPAAWSRLVDDYMASVEAELAVTPFAQRRRSLRFARPLATHFMQWVIDHHAQLAFAGGTATKRSPRRLQEPSTHPPLKAPAGAVITGPELARLLGLTRQAVNYWARQHPIGAELHGWRLAGRGKRYLQELGYLVPPGGPPSWLFERPE